MVLDIRWVVSHGSMFRFLDGSCNVQTSLGVDILNRRGCSKEWKSYF